MPDPGLLLARLGGADHGVLARATKVSKRGASIERAKFVSLGLVLIGVAGLAMLSMTVALIDGLHVSLVPAVFIGLFWGLIILNLDRALVLALQPGGGKWRLISMIMPRVVIAALLGLVISTPVTLRIFNDGVDQQLTVDNTRRAEDAARLITNGDRQKQIEAVNAEIARYEGYLAGDVPFTTPELEAASADYQQAEADYDTKQAVAERARRDWVCELYGMVCGSGQTGVYGNGAQAQAAQIVYERLQADADAARLILQDKQIALTEAQSHARGQFPDRVVAAQTEANQALPDLRRQRDSMQAEIQSELARSQREAAENTGLLARLLALSHLREDNASVRLTYRLVIVLLFALQLLPVAIRSLSILGPPTLYDRIDADVLLEEVQARIDMVLRGPTLVNYDGWVSLTADDRPGVTLSSAQRCLTLDAPGAFDLTVSIAPDDRGDVSERLIVSDGVDATEAEFTVEVDSDQAALRRAPKPLRVDAPGGTGVATFAFNLTDTAYGVTPWLWFRVSQASRTLQNVELSIEVAPATQNAERPAVPGAAESRGHPAPSRKHRP